MTLTRCPEHQMPTIECEGVQLAGHRRRRRLSTVLADALVRRLPVTLAAYVIVFWACVGFVIAWARS